MIPRLTIALLLVLAVAAPAAAQSDALEIQSVEDSGYPTVELTILVPERVASVPLAPDMFEVSEDGESRGRPSLGAADAPSGDPQEAAAPRTVLAIDVSGSMQYDIDTALSAAASFVSSLRPGSEVAIVTFGNRAQVVTDFTSDTAAVLEDLETISVDPAAETALFDGVLRANQLLARAADDAPDSIVLLADGDDSVAPSKRDQTIAALEEGGATLWAVALRTTDSNPKTLEALARGGERVLSADNADELQGIYASLASDLSRQYLLRYESETSGPTDISVELDQGVVTASTSIRTTLEGTPAGQDTAPEPVPIASPDPFTVTVPLLGTTTAYGVGLGALVLAAVLGIWLIALGRPPKTGRERLLATPSLQHRPGLSVVAEWMTEQADRRLREREFGGVIDRALEGAGLDLRTGEFVIGVLSGVVVAYAVGMAIAGPLFGILLSVVVPVLARLVLNVRRDRRQAAFADQFIDVLQLLAGNLRAGYGMLQGIDAVSRDALEPASGEFRRILIEHRLGRDLTQAMENCAVRMNNRDFEWVVQAISIHREVGGDLARVLDNIVTTVRERAAMHRQVRALSAEGRMSAWVLTALPFVTFLIIHATSPEYMQALTSRGAGWIMIGVAIVMLTIGTIVIRRLVKIEY